LDSSTDVFIIARVAIKDLSYLELRKQLEYLFRKQKLIKGEKNG
jgi:RNase P protein component